MVVTLPRVTPNAYHASTCKARKLLHKAHKYERTIRRAQIFPPLISIPNFLFNARRVVLRPIPR